MVPYKSVVRKPGLETIHLLKVSKREGSGQPTRLSLGPTSLVLLFGTHKTNP